MLADPGEHIFSPWCETRHCPQWELWFQRSCVGRFSCTRKDLVSNTLYDKQNTPIQPAEELLHFFLLIHILKEIKDTVVRCLRISGGIGAWECAGRTEQSEPIERSAILRQYSDGSSSVWWCIPRIPWWHGSCHEYRHFLTLWPLAPLCQLNSAKWKLA